MQRSLLTLMAQDEWDPCAGKHGGVQTSVEAHERVRGHKGADSQKIIELTRAAGMNGLTSKESAAIMQKPLNAISGRYSEPTVRGALRRTDMKRDGCFVWVFKAT